MFDLSKLTLFGVRDRTYGVNFSLLLRSLIKGGSKAITLLENAIIFANGTKYQFCFDICEVNKRRTQIDEP